MMAVPKTQTRTSGSYAILVIPLVMPMIVSKTHDYSDTDSIKVPVTPEVQAAVLSAPETLLADTVEGGNYWLSDITIASSGKGN